MLRVPPGTADHKWLNRARPGFRDSINHPIEPTDSTPTSSPMMSANTTVAEDRADLAEWRPASGSRGIVQGYHQAGCPPSFRSICLRQELSQLVKLPAEGERGRPPHTRTGLT